MKMLNVLHFLILLLLLLLFALPSSSLGEVITLSSESDFIDFVNKVNTGSTYSGDTVYLGSDITLSGAIDLIGNESSYYFLGTFDGQGHVISDLKIDSSLEFTGLFGYSKGLTIRNVVLDGSCSVMSLTTSSSVSVGGFIGECHALSGECGIENSVNMADISFSGSISDKNMFIGGLVGYFFSLSYNAYVKNCVNYGSITDSGTVNNKYVELGGIVGISTGISSKNTRIQNCVNYGTITHSGTSTYLYVGGVVGNGASYTYIENCVSAGKILTPTIASEDNYVGSIVGYVKSNVFINYCYYTTDVNSDSINGAGTVNSTTGTPNFPTDVNPELVSKLNSNATSCNWAKWFMLHLNGGSINNLTQELLVEIQGHIPDPVKEGNSFMFWCKDVECDEVFDPETESVSGITDIYAGWESGTVTFDFDNGTTVNVTFSYNTEITYPDIKEEGYTLFWANYHELMPARDITVTAQWTPNNYTVTFDFGNGTTVNETFTYNTEIAYPVMKKEGYTLSWANYHELMPARYTTVTAQWTPNNYTVTFDANGGDVSETSKLVTFDEKYGKLPEPRRTGYAFLGWFTEKTGGTEVTNETIVTTPDNHTLYAHWEEVTNQVEIVFNTKDLTEDEVKNIIEQYTKADFTIAKFENESGEIRAIIKFAGKEDAEKFVRNIKESDRAMNKFKKVSFDQGIYNSFSTMFCPFSFLGALLFL